ncbi:MAG: hypothetical protein GOV01_00470 [Candidatus Altiarchaeota archaeon]|nr:hypothetical protein [Candidatus Altiarchaeota archaeon]
MEKFINIERIVDTVITRYYVGPSLGERTNKFMFDILYDERFSFGQKKKILEKILKRIGKYNNAKMRNLHRISEIRNYFAHREPFFIREEGTVAPDPKNPEENLDFEKLHEEFLEKEKLVNNFLFEILASVGVVLKKGV